MKNLYITFLISNLFFSACIISRDHQIQLDKPGVRTIFADVDSFFL
jgi:hypothetical protein